MNILVMNGSPRTKGSNSQSIANYVAAAFEKAGKAQSKVVQIRGSQAGDELVRIIDKADCVVLVAPIFENTLPASVLEAFELLCDNRNKLSDKGRKLLVITNSGFPELNAHQGAHETSRLFAASMGFEWLGSGAVAPGTLIDGKDLSDAGGYRKLVRFIDQAVESIGDGRPIPVKTFRLIAKPFISPRMYRFFGSRIQKKAAKGMGKNVYYAQPLVKPVNLCGHKKRSPVR